MGLILLLSLSNYALRFLRWKIYLSTSGYHVPWIAHILIYLSGFALTLSPAKIGEGIRGIFLSRYGIPQTVNFGALITERLSDLIAILLLCFLGFSYIIDNIFVFIIVFLFLGLLFSVII